MRHEVLTHRGGNARQPRRRGRRVRDGCQARPAGDGAGAARGLGPGCTERRSLRLSYRSNCAFRSRRRPGGVGRDPPASLRGTMGSGPTGQMCSSNPPPGCGGVAPGPAGLGLGPWRTERRSRSVHRLTKMASRRRFRAFVYTVATRVALGDTSVSATMGCLRRRWSPASAGHLLSACFGCPSRTLPLRCE